MLLILDPAGSLTEPEFEPGEAQYLDRLDPERLLAMYRDMAITRAFDAEATALQRRGELGLWVSSLGQEGAQVGSAHALGPNDYAFPAYREHGVVAARGVDPAQVLPLFRGVDHGGWDTEAHRCHTYTLVVGAHAPHAVGYAMGLALDAGVVTPPGSPTPTQPVPDGAPTSDRDPHPFDASATSRAAPAAGPPAPPPGAAGNSALPPAAGLPASPPGAAVLVYLGDGAMAQGDVSEALVFAASYRAPIVFFIQNNGWAISTPTAAHARVPFARRGEGFGIPGRRVDGNDPLACYVATAAALERARTGGGPGIVEAVTYRMAAHTTADDPSRYRDPAEEARWAERDPLARVAAHLRATGTLDEERSAGIEEEARATAERARATCLAMPAPSPDTLLARVYASDSERLAGGR
jgi:pyruvate dehydrogenase E1 component alpha subunit